MAADTGSFDQLKASLADVGEPIGKRTHAAFVLRTMGGNEAVAAIGEVLRKREDSALLRHELAYVLGQMQNKTACPVLEEVLRRRDDDCMVRHEAAEALGAIGDYSALPVLREFATDPAVEVSQTCELALDLIAWREKEEADRALEQTNGKTYVKHQKNSYLSVDPAPPTTAEEGSVDTLKAILCDQSASLFSRYRAMFSLRNRGDEAAVLALAGALVEGSKKGGGEGEEDRSGSGGQHDVGKDKEALFRHEIAYVLGQLQHPASAPALIEVLENVSDHSMVRHEAAEALGAISTAEAQAALVKALQRPGEDQVVKESCMVALDTMDYWQQLNSKTNGSEAQAETEVEVEAVPAGITA